MGRAAVEPAEHVTPEGFVATCSFEDLSDEMHRWDVGARISSKRVVVYSHNDDGTRDELRHQARRLFDSIRVD